MKVKAQMFIEAVCFAIGIIPFLVGSFFLWMQDRAFEKRMRLESEYGK